MAATLRERLEPTPTFAELYQAVRGSLPAASDADVKALRDASLARFQRHGLPGVKSEAWKYTPLATFNTTPFQRPDPVSVDPELLAPHIVPEADRFVFVNGTFSADLSAAVAPPPGVRISVFSKSAVGNPSDLLEALGDFDDTQGLSALNAALLSDGVHVRVAPGRTTERPVHVIFVSTRAPAGPVLSNVRNVIDVGEGGRAEVVETHLFADPGDNAANLVNRVRLGDGAKLGYDRLQVGDPAGTLLGRSEFQLAADSRLTQSLVTTAGKLVRNEIAARLEGRGIEALFHGLYLTRERQLHDNTLQIRHAAPGCHSDQFYKGVLDDRARAVFAGKIMVDRIAQQTNAYQANNNLLLSPDAEIDTKPELEIFADDVKCSHGATAGDLDETGLFYLRSRGIAPELARSLLTYAFAGEVLERFSIEASKEQARRAVLGWLPGGHAFRELG